MQTIMLDNASIHRSKATVDHARSLDFTIVWNVPYHPEFNGIEFVWAIVKKKFRDLQLQRMLGTSPLSFVEAVWEALSSVTASEVSSCINHGISNLDAAGSLLNSMQPPGGQAGQIPVVQCSRLIS